MGKVAAAVLAYNCADVVREMLDSLVEHVDLIVVNIDSKTTDDTRAVIEKWAEGEDRPRVHIFDDAGDHAADFAAARNINFGHAWTVEDDVEWVIWVDTDDVFWADAELRAPPLRDWLAEQPPIVTHVFLPYLYHYNEHGDVTTHFDRERIFRKSGAPLWKMPIHEVAEVRFPMRGVRSELYCLQHKNATTQTDQSRGERNFKALRALLEREPNSAFAMKYLGYQHFAANQWTEAAEFFERYLNTPSTEAPIEKWQVLIWLARARRNEGDVSASIKAATLALQSHPEYPDAYHELAHSYAMRRQWAKAIEWHEMGVSKDKRPPAILIASPQDYTSNPYRVAHTCYYQLGRFAEAIDAATKALEWAPGDPFLKARGSYYVAAWDRSKAIDAIAGSAKFLLARNEPMKARLLLRSLPAGAVEEKPGVQAVIDEVEAALAHLRSEEDYENFYLAEQPEKIAPDETQIEKVPEWYPRMEWVCARMRQARADSGTDPLDKKWSVLVIGVGNAIEAFYYAKHGFKVVGTDVDPKRVKDANWNAVKLGYLPTEERTEPIRVMHQNIEAAKQKVKDEEAYLALLRTGKADGITAGITDEHIAKQEEVIESWRTRLAKLQEEFEAMPREVPTITADSPIQFHWSPANELHPRIKELAPFDFVVAAEVIEHVEFPEKFLEFLEGINGEGPKPRIILTTPDGSWRGPQARNPSHVWAWSRLEFETLFVPRGLVWNADVIDHPFGDQPNLGIDYVPGAEIKAKFLDRPPVSIYCGAGLEKWSPHQIDKDGLGGSETAVVMLSRELARRGMRVTVYAEWEGILDGVRYRKHDKFNPRVETWITVLWRAPHMLDQQFNTRHLWFWAHDTDYADRLTEKNLRPVDTYLVVSHFHKAHTLEKYPFLAKPYRCGIDAHDHEQGPCDSTDDQPTCSLAAHAHDDRCVTEVVVIYNGIDASKFDGAEERQHRRAVYVSSPDRGLEQALRYWPKVREFEPEATLDIFYGWDNFDLMGGPQSFKRAIRKLADQPGVTWKGRIGQKALARELMKASVLFYPGPHTFQETFCISVVEAQAAGCVPVTRDNGALRETNLYGALLPNVVEHDPKLSDEEKAEREARRWALALCDAMHTSEKQRGKMKEWARTVTWGKVADAFVNRALALERLALDREQPRQEEPAASPAE